MDWTDETDTPASGLTNLLQKPAGAYLKKAAFDDSP